MGKHASSICRHSNWCVNGIPFFFLEADPSNQFHLMNFYNIHNYLLQVIVMTYMWLQYNMNNDTSLLMITHILIIIEINTLHLLMH